MADSSIDPQSQASLDALRGELSKLGSDMARLEKNLVASEEASKKAAAESQRAARTGSPAATGGAAGAAGAESGAIDKLAASETRAVGATDQLAVSQARLRTQLEETTAQYLKYDTTLATTGGLSAAALQAVARGTLTMRELGNQVSQTIGKFAGWTGAAAAVYGVLGAFDELKKGAIDSSSAVTALSRFIPAGKFNAGDARNSLVEQAQQTATPIKDVGDASQQFAKVFKDQGDVFTATHVALTASKLDNIALADSYKYLTALVQEWGVSANQLPGIFDQVTAAQDKFGAKVSVTLPALARSVSTVKNSGGDLSQLIALESLAAVRSGATGEVIGTAFSTGAGRFYPQASGRGIRQRIGSEVGANLDTGSFTQDLINAIQKGGSLNGDQRRQLVQAFFGAGGGRGGARLAGIFNDAGPELQKALGATAPGGSAGLADTQLKKAMEQADNQIKELKVNLQSIGAELAGSGLATPLGAALHLLNAILSTATDLLKVFNSLPGPIKDIVSLGGTSLGAIALARRFDIGGSIAQGRGPTSRALEAVGVGPLLSRRPEVQQALDAKNVTKSIEEQYRNEIAASYALANKQAFTAQTAGTRAEKVAALRSSIEAQTQGQALVGGLAAYRAGGGTSAADLGKPMEEAQRKFIVSSQGVATETTATSGKMARALEGVNSVMSRMAAFAIPALAAALIGLDVAKSIKERTKKGESALEKATTPEEAKKAYDKERGGWLFRLFDSGNDQDAYAAQYQAKLKELASAQSNNLSTSTNVNELLRAGKYGQAFNTFRNDRGLQNENPNQYNKTFNALYEKQEAQKQGFQPGKNDPFAEVRALSDDLKNKLSPYITGLGDAGKVFGTTDDSLGKLAAAYAFAVNKLGGNQNDAQAMQALVSAQGQLVSDVSKRVTSLLDLGKSQTTNAGQASYFDQATQIVPQAQAKVRQFFAQIEKGASPAQIKKDQEAMNEVLGLLAKERQAAISAVLGLVKSQTDLKVSQVQGIGPAADLQRAQVTLSGLQGELAKAKTDGADAQTINSIVASINNQQRTVLQQKITNAQSLIQAQAQYAASGVTDPIQQAQIELQFADKQLSALAALGQNASNNPTLILPLLAQKQAAVIKQADAALSQFEAQQQLTLTQQDIGQSQGARLQNAIGSAQQVLSYVQGLGSKASPLKIIQAQQALAQAQSAWVDYQIQEGRALIEAEAAAASSATFDPVKIAQNALAAARRLLAYDQAHNASGSQLASDRAKIGDAWKNIQTTKEAQLEATIQFEASTYQITSAEEIALLQKRLQALKKQHAAIGDIQRLQKEIYDLQFTQGGELNLNVGNIKLPSTYEVKSAIKSANAGARIKTTAGLLADVKTNVQMEVHIARDVDLKKFTDALNEALGTSTQGIAQAAGLI